MEDFNKLQDNMKKNSLEERINEYAQQILNISSIEEAKKQLKNIFVSEQKANFDTEIKRNSEKKSGISRENIIQMFMEYKKYSILEIQDSFNPEEEIKEFTKNNRSSFKKGMNIFFIELMKEHPSVAVVDIEDIDNINFIEDTIDIYSVSGDSDLLVRFNMEHNFITPEQIKK